MTDGKIDVLVVDDSSVARMLICHLLETDPLIRVIGAVHDGQAAVEFLQGRKPDVVVMDIHMPRLDGFEATRQIMETQPVPIVICTATTNAIDVATTFRSIEAGAVACVAKPVSSEHPQYPETVAHLLQTVRLMSEVRVVRRWPRKKIALSAPALAAPAIGDLASGNVRVIGIGASTGGPPLLQAILSSLPKNLPVPVLIVQHIAHGFLPGLVEWLQQSTGWPVHIGTHGELPLAGHAYLAPDDLHMGLGANGRICLSRDVPQAALRPAVGFLFQTLAEHCRAEAVGVLLTGMGRDGAAELKLMKEAGAETIAQDRETSVVHGMPGEAIAIGAATHVLPGDKIAPALTQLCHRRFVNGALSP